MKTNNSCDKDLLCCSYEKIWNCMHEWILILLWLGNKSKVIIRMKLKFFQLNWRKTYILWAKEWKKCSHSHVITTKIVERSNNERCAWREYSRDKQSTATSSTSTSSSIILANTFNFEHCIFSYILSHSKADRECVCECIDTTFCVNCVD